MKTDTAQKIIVSVLVCILSFVVVVSAVMIWRADTQTRAVEKIEIYKDGVLFESVTTSDLVDARYIEVGDGNVVLCDESGAIMHYADCPDKLCVKQGRVKASQTVVCLPNRVTVKVIGKKNTQIDAVTG